MAMVASGQLWPIPAKTSLLVLICLCVCHTSTAAAAAATSPTPEALLRAAAARRTRTVFTLTRDVSLTRGVVNVTCPDFAIVGRCTTGGRARRCKIDGLKKTTAFNNLGSRFNLTNLLLTRFKPRRSSYNVIVDRIGEPGDEINIDNCLFTKNVGQLFGIGFGHTINLKNSSLIENDGVIIDFTQGSMRVEGVLFRSNHGGSGPLFFGYRGHIDFINCGFENNTSPDSLFELSYQGTATFVRSWFVNNKATRVGARGALAVLAGGMASVDFCYCRFQGNTVALPRGRTRREDVYVSTVPMWDDDIPITFCPKRPSVVVAYANPAFVVYVNTTCERCRGLI